MNLLRNFLISFVISLVLFDSPSFSMIAMIDEANLPGQKCLIKNVRHNEYLYVNPEEINRVRGSSSISSNSSFLFEKKNEGYLIKNLSTNTYLFLADRLYSMYIDDTCIEDRLVETSNNIMANSYFELIKVQNSYVIKNKKYSDYIDLNPCHVGVGIENQLWSNRIITEHSPVVFLPFPSGLF